MRFNRMSTRIISALLVLTMVLTMVPISVIPVAAAEGSQLKVNTVSAIPGETVELIAVMENAPDIKSMAISDITYDASKMTLSEVEWLPDAEIKNWNSAQGRGVLTFGENTDANGPVLKMTFKIKDVADDSDVSISFTAIVKTMDDDDSEVPVEVAVVPGKVEIRNETRGDMDGNTKVNSSDAVYLLYYTLFGGEDYPIRQSGDMDGNGKIDSNDAVYLLYHVLFGEQEYPISRPCAHIMEEIPFKAPTCTEDGNIEYYHCTTCGKNFNDSVGTKELATTVMAATGHKEVIDPAVEPTYEDYGWTEGSHCSVCDKVLKAQERIDKLKSEEYLITYKLPSADTYLEEIEAHKANANPTTYTANKGVGRIEDLEIPGYKFHGWYTEPEGGGTRVDSIPVGTTGNKTLYAHMEPREYKITFDSPDVPLDPVTYTVDTGATLKNPSHFGYTFVGWSMDGKIMTSIPVGTTGNITLRANWTSDRNKAKAVNNLGTPIIIEDMAAGQYLFIYEIGTIQNVPLAEIADLGNTEGISFTQSYSYSQTVNNTFAETIAQTVSNATTTTSSWTLSEDWNDTTSATNEHEEEKGKTEQTTDSQGNVVEGKYYVSNVEGGSTTNTTSAGGSSGTSSKVTTGNSTGINGSYTSESTDSSSVELGMDVSLSASIQAGPAAARYTMSGEISASADTSTSSTDMQSHTTANSRSDTFTDETNNSSESHWDTSASESSTWNSTESYESASATSINKEISNAISERIYDKYGYSSTIERGGENSTTASTGNSAEETNEYASTVEYSVGEEKNYTETVTRQSSASGYYRLVSAGTVHVFAVVGYDIATHSYYTYTYNVLDAERHIFLDYSKDNANFNDCENAILPFEVPYAVHEYVSGVISRSEDLEIDESTGIITEYTGTAKYVVIPEYVSVTDGVSRPYAVRVRGISKGAFAGNANIMGVYLPKYINTIPDGAFAGCTSLEVIMGYGVSTIGANAFDGCISLSSFNVDKYITSLGNNAFVDVPEIKVVAANESVADAASKSGAKRITVDISGLKAYDNKVISIPNTAGYFAIIGNSSNSGVSYKNLRIESDADETFISNMTFADNEYHPLKISSAKVTLSKVNVEAAPGFALVLTGDNVNLDLYGTVNMQSSSGNAVISKNVTLAKSNANVAGELKLDGNYLVCGGITNSNMMSFTSGKVINLSASEYENMLTSSVLTLDPNGGQVSNTEKRVYYGQGYGDLPTPTRTGYNFMGWYTAKSGGTKVTSDTVVTQATNHTLYAQWSTMAYKVSWNTGIGYTVNVERTSSPYAGASTGALTNNAVVYYGDVLEVTYAATTGYSITSKGSTSITVSGNVTKDHIYAAATVNAYKVSWSTGTGYSIEVSRTSSPLKGAATGSLSSGAAVYHGDVLSVTYTATTGYTIGSKGSTSITVSGNVTKDHIYATASVNAYKVTWDAVANCSVVVNRTSSPLKGAATGTLISGDAIYYGDVLSVTYTANNGYSLSSKGSTSITVSGNVTKDLIKASASPNDYTYNIVYKSSNGTNLGSSTATFKFGTTNTISAPGKSGYNTPGSQTVKWDSTSAKTITFTYTPAGVSNGTHSGYVTNDTYYKLAYAANVEYQNRTANSVQVRVVVTATLSGSGVYNAYGQRFSSTVGGVGTGTVVITNYGTWKNASSSARSASAGSGWITVPLNTTNATSVGVDLYYFQANANGTDITPTYASNLRTSWTINIPAY